MLDAASSDNIAVAASILLSATYLVAITVAVASPELNTCPPLSVDVDIPATVVTNGC